MFYYRRSELTTDSKNLLSVVFLVREGPLGECLPSGDAKYVHSGDDEEQ